MNQVKIASFWLKMKRLQNLFTRLRQLLIHLIYLVGLQKLMKRFKESYSIIQITLIFLKSRKTFNLTKDLLFSMFLRLLSENLWKTSPRIKCLRFSDITSVFEKLDLYEKANYRPLSILPLVLNIFEKSHISSALWLHGKFSQSFTLLIP